MNTLSNDDSLMYRNNMENTLSNVDVNLLCDDPKCISQSHRNAIERMYCDITTDLA